MMLVQIYKNFRPEVPFNHIGHLGPIRVVRSCILLQSVPIARFLKPYLVEDQLHLPLYLKTIQNFQVRLHRKYYRYFQFIMIRLIKRYSLRRPRAASWGPVVYGTRSCPCLTGKLWVHPVAYRGPLFTGVITCLCACISCQGI